MTRNDRPAFQITDTYGPGDDEVLGHISPTGELLDTDPTPASNRTEQAAPSDDAILDEIMDEFEHGL
ncbi:hypothetical protein C465_09460 [Halorubrum distributum JCM 9100]|uniref:Uncharacterized protein n=2 Tax=Halorubrum distributum TaxID=29283 RepID=M0EKN9_9EURY|nr:hypothetical protein C465_09460 [Halorubrum distributum JCM 9100]ELZ55701.1 hypothetical protein C466_05178 [Halorubrum distributum JCM 10118]